MMFWAVIEIVEGFHSVFVFFVETCFLYFSSRRHTLRRDPQVFTKHVLFRK